MDIIVKGHEYFYDITSMLLLFFPGSKAEYVDKIKSDTYIKSFLKQQKGKVVSVTKIKLCGKIYSSQKTANVGSDTKDLVKYTFYKACNKATNIASQWGILTGISPLSVYKKLAKVYKNPNLILLKKYLVSNKKVQLLKTIYDYNNKIVTTNNNDISVYISIPFCPSKCTYCSFISVSCVNKQQLMQDYVLLLCKEIELKSKLISKNNLNLKSIYIGGGTPGILTHDQLLILLKTVSKCFDIKPDTEKCFELGRPDTVDSQKLEILKSYGFNRVCINTQTTNDQILQSVNRKHSAKQYFDAVKLTQSMKFDVINTDLIAGLPGEDLQSFKKSVDDVINSNVNNVTVHTLAIKRAATLASDSSNYCATRQDVDDMMDYAYDRLVDSGYIPYYLYRQKNCLSNGENIGFCKADAACMYNIYMMESIHSVIACGAGASTKIVNGTNVERVINVKYPIDYVADFDKIINNTNKTEQLLKKVINNG